MGISGLAYLLSSLSPGLLCENGLKDYAGKVIAMDASQYLYQVMSPRRSKHQPLNVDNTSPLLRTFHNCIKLLNNGIKPLYVFDGRPPKLKSEEIKVRVEKREEAIVAYKEAESKGDVESMHFLKPQTVKVGKMEMKNCQGLLKLMGIPYYISPGEAEAQCAVFVESGKAYATATQDMDALTYGTKVVLRHLPLGNITSKFPMQEIRLEKVLAALQLSLPQFIDLSILLGCDYCKGIKGLGSHRAIELLHKHGNIENILEKVDRKKLVIPGEWLYKEARELFQNPKVTGYSNNFDFRWEKPDIEGVVQYLTGENLFEEKLIRKSLQKVNNL